MNDEYKKMLERFEQICQNAKKELCSKEEKEQEKRFIEKINKELTINEYDEIENWLASVEALDNNAINDILEENKRLNNKLKDIKSQLDYLETYSSKEDVFEDMKRRLDRIDKILGSDKE